MNNVRNKKRANKSLPFFFKDEFKVFFVIIFVSTILLVTTFTFDKVPPILNRGIQPATFPKGLLVLIIFLTAVIYYLSFKNPWKKEKKLPKPFFLTILSFILFVVISKTLDFFLAKKKSNVLEITTNKIKLKIVKKNGFGSFFSFFQGFLNDR